MTEKVFAFVSPRRRALLKGQPYSATDVPTSEDQSIQNLRLGGGWALKNRDFTFAIEFSAIRPIRINSKFSKTPIFRAGNRR